MQELDDNALLREYVEHASEEAFTLLVTRHINKVYSVALRHTRNAHLAEEMTQSTFGILARKARNLGKDVVLSGWLYQTARLTAMTLVRSEIRRTQREQEAHMQTLSNDSESSVWPQIEPLLDTAMAGLNETDRHAVVLRFFDGKSMKEVGVALGGSEDAAKMRVNRAVEKLRLFFSKRGIVLPAAALTAAISGNAVQAAPVGLVATLSTAALAGKTLATTATATATKAIAMTTLQKTLIAATLVAGMATLLMIQRQTQVRLRDENAFLRQRIEQLSPLTAETKRLSNLVVHAVPTLSRDQLNDLLRLRSEVGMLRRQTNELARLEAENQQLRSSPTTAGAKPAKGGDIPPFTAEGTVLTEVFQHPIGPPTARMEEAVTFCYSNDWWRIELKYKSGFHSSIPPQSLEGNTISCQSIPGGTRILTSHTPALIANAYLPADVEATVFPPPERQNLLVCWLTLFPKPRLPVLSKTTMRRLISAEFLKDPQNQGEYGLKYCDGGIFVSELCITNNGIIQVGRQSAGHPTRKLRPPFEQGHFEFEYRVLETTNRGGLSFPLRSVLRTYVSNKDGTSRDDVRVAVIESFKVESFRTGEIPKPQIDSSRIVALDNRLPAVPGRGSGSVTYAVTNDSWLAATNPALVQLAEVQKTNAVEIPKDRSSR